MSGPKLACSVTGFRPAYGKQRIAFFSGKQLRVNLHGMLGQHGLSAKAADLVDLAMGVYQIERLLRGRQRTNPPRLFEVSVPMRAPEAWSQSAVAAAERALRILGEAEWRLSPRSGLKAPVPEAQLSGNGSAKCVSLFSGGMDSSCGAASLAARSDEVRLVSFYTRQRTLQRELASELGFEWLCQWHHTWEGDAGRGRSFYYRSFLFLCLAAAVAESWGVRSILQFENGVLASAVPPTPAWRMTNHAHSSLHRTLEELFSALFGGRWSIENPFLLKTKRGVLRAGEDVIGRSKMRKIVERTETCWSHWQSRVGGGKRKAPGVRCGACIPCLIRRTALPREHYAFDLRADRWKNDPAIGRAFRSYYSFVERTRRAKTPADFYSILPGGTRALVTSGDGPSLAELQAIFNAFAEEFRQTFSEGGKPDQ